MSLLRSETMGYYNMVMPRETAWEVLNELGKLDALQFIDLNADQAPFAKPYVNYVKRCDEMENKIFVIQEEMKKYRCKIEKCPDVGIFLKNLKKFLIDRNKAEHTYFDEVESHLDERLKSLEDQIRTRDTLVENFNHLVEYRQVLLRAYSYVGGSGADAQDLSERLDRSMRNDEEKIINMYRGAENIRFTYLAGVINRDDSQRFKRILFRVTRGMVWTTLIDIETAQTDHKKMDLNHLVDTSAGSVNKSIFVIIYQGGSHEMMASKLNKIIDSFGASKYGLPSDRASYDRKLLEIENQLKEGRNVIMGTNKLVETVLEHFSKPRSADISYSLVEELRMFVLKEKIIYNNLNKLKLQNTLYRGSCWCPVKLAPRIQDAISELKRKRSDIGGCEFQEASKPPEAKPPTFFKLNKFTWIFQEIVNTYGIPRYREINPGLFTIATFPFLFGVMFGDIGHGLLLLLAGLYLVFFKSSIEKNPDTMWKLLLPGRYLIAMQGFFAFYCGWIYNDFMSIPFNLFGTCYTHDDSGFHLKENCTYPVGIDSAWGGASNELTYINSFKMKLAIVLGVSQMMFGILLRGFNAIHFRSVIDFFCEFVPMFLFLGLTFGYMVVLIFLKWAIPWGTPEYPISEAPSIIAIFIKMALSPGQWPDGLGIALYGDREGKHQASLQLYFLVIAMICAVMILVPKPLILWLKHNRDAKFYNLVPGEHHKTNKKLLSNDEIEIQLDDDHKDESEFRNRSSNSIGSHVLQEHEHFDFGEIFVHQVIEAIEFVLGSISNTASYLRLWALSLAHSQLAKVFFDNCLVPFMKSGNILGIIIGYMMFAEITFGVLLLMDQMECFLHALRLHWVEFQNKFYKADGYAFDAFGFKKAITEAVKDQ